jgi:nitrogen fixation protein FixH
MNWTKAIRFQLVLLSVIMVFAPTAYGKEFTVTKKIDGYTLNVVLSQNPPVTGKNGVRIEIKDSQGKPVADTPVTVNYFMPPMRDMPPMNYTVKTQPHGPEYRATMDFIMRGPWNIVVKADVGTKQFRVAIVVDVR